MGLRSKGEGSMRFDVERALTRSEAVSALKSGWKLNVAEELVDVRRSCGRVLARDCFARYDLPRHRVSAMDGIAVRSADFADGMPDTSAWVRGVDFVQADTGDDFPDAFDAVVAIENVAFDEGDRLRFLEDLKVEAGRSVKPAGATMRAEELLYPQGTLVDPFSAAILAAGGWGEVPVIARPKVAFIPTGTELVPVGVEPQRGENVETNSLMLSALFEQWGADTVVYDIVVDDKEKLAETLDRALSEADIVLINGGSSCGSEDFNSFLLQERASWFAHGVKAVPGRPIGMALIEGKPAVNVPGPMIAAALAADWLIRSLILHYLGRPMPQRQRVNAVLDNALSGRPGFEMLARLVTREVDGVLHAASVPSGSTLAENIRAVDAFLAVPADVRFEKDDVAEVELLGTVTR